MKFKHYIAVTAVTAAVAGCSVPVSDTHSVSPTQPFGSDMSWNQVADAAYSQFRNNIPNANSVDPSQIQRAATACGNYVRSNWHKSGTYASRYNRGDLIITVEWGDNSYKGCSVTGANAGNS